MMTRSMSKKTKLSIFSDLPQEIIHSEILPRLPVKSLLRFKKVSKSWCSLISTRNFAKTQLHYSAKTTPLTEYNAVLVSSGCQGFIISHCLVNSLFTHSSMNVDDFDSSHWMMGHVPRIVGCSNGLCCILINEKHFDLWNPSTGEIRRLPPAEDKFKWAQVEIHGFGYDEYNDDYKVVAVLTTKSLQQVFRLYSLRANSWKTVNNFFGPGTFVHHRTFDGKGALVDGKLHWMGNEGLEIVSFDLGMEVAGVVEPPSCEKLFWNGIDVIKGCLSVICYAPNQGIQVWVMKEYGVKESWSRVVTVPRPYNHIFCMSEDVVVVDHKVGIDNNSTLYIYNPKTKSVSHVKLKGLGTSQVDFCMQSLVSPFRHGELGEPN